MQVTFDLDNASDRRRVRSMLDDADALEGGTNLTRGQTSPVGPNSPRRTAATAEQPGVLLRRIREMLQEGYGRTRRELVRRIAEESPSTLPKAVLYAEAAKVNPDSPPHLVVGGLHSSLERSWAAVGGEGKFFDTSSNGFTMAIEIATAVRQALDEWDKMHADNSEDE